MAPKSNKSDKTSEKSESQELSGADAVGLRIRNAAHVLNYSQAELCRKAEIKAQTLNGYWNGKTLPKPAQLFALAEALDLNPRWLATGKGHPAPPIELDPDRADLEGRLLDAWRRLDLDQQAHVIENAEMLLGMYRVPRLKLDREVPLTVHDPDRSFRGEED